MPQPLLCASVPLAAFVLHPFSRSLSLQMEQQLLGGPVCLPALDLEKWYQEVMAGFETSSSSVSPSSSPPPLPAKAHSCHKALQVILAVCCQGSGFGAAGCGQSGAVWGRSCGPCTLSAAGALAATAGKGRAVA